MLTPELLARIRRLEITSAKLVEEIFSGKYLSVFKGRGIEFSDIRDYQWGDDIRSMHWRAMARFADKAFIKRFSEERQLTVFLAIDFSGSLEFGSKNSQKGEVLQDIGGLIAYLALKNKDKAGLLIFSDKIELYLAPKGGRAHALRILRELVGFEAKSKKTNIAHALEFIANTLKKRAILFLLSDFLGNGYEKALTLLAKKHDLIAISVDDPLEEVLPVLPAKIALQDLEEENLKLTIDLRQSELLKILTESLNKQKQTRDNLFAACGIDHLKLSTDGNFVDALVKFFTAREERILRG